jgi:apolipoprotein N-acyltransferase
MYIYGELPASASMAGVLAMASIQTVILSVLFVIAFWLHKKGFVSLIIGLPVCWTLYEWVRNYVPFGGYPWAQLAYSQASHLSLIQSVDIVGLYGITFLIVIVNLAVVELAEYIPDHSRHPVLPVLMAVLLMGTNVTYGIWRIQDINKKIEKMDSLTVALAQPNIPQSIKWSPGQAKESLRILFKLTDQTVDRGVDLGGRRIIKKQDILPSNLEELYELAGRQVSILTGAVTVLPPGDKPIKARPLLQNSAVQFDPEGKIAGMYHKTHLVPLGEYVPLKDVLGFLEKVVPAIGDFIPGSEYKLMALGDKSYGVTICYEDLFPEISRAFTLKGADFLTNITNDAWYNDSSAQWQHLTFSQFRAIENRRTMLRSTNTGVTAIIDPTGRIRAQLTPFEQGILVESIAVGGPDTIYTRYGDILWLGFFGLLLAISVVIRIINYRRRICP